MCLGIPLQVLDSEGSTARCAGRGLERRIDLSLVGAQPPGTWLLTFLGAAREVLDPETAARIDSALDAVEAVMNGETDIDRHFADLIERGPQLPAHLMPALPERGSLIPAQPLPILT